MLVRRGTTLDLKFKLYDENGEEIPNYSVANIEFTLKDSYDNVVIKHYPGTIDYIDGYYFAIYSERDTFSLVILEPYIFYQVRILTINGKVCQSKISKTQILDSLSNDILSIEARPYSLSGNSFSVKVENISAAYEKTAQSDWNQTQPSAPDYIRNKPDIGSITANLENVKSEVILKADKTYVDQGLANKANTTYVEGIMLAKADKSYVDNISNSKVDNSNFISAVNRLNLSSLIPEFDDVNYRLTFRDHSNEIKLIVDLPLEDFAQDIDYDNDSKELLIHKSNDEIVRVPIGDLVDTYIGGSSNTTDVTIIGNTIRAAIRTGSIDYTHLSNTVIANLTAIENAAAEAINKSADAVLKAESALSDLQNKAASIHSHNQSEISGLTNALANKQDKLSSEELNNIADITNKADRIHSHEITDISNLKTIIDEKQDKLTQEKNGGAGVFIDETGRINNIGESDGETIKNQNASSDVEKIKTYFGNSAEFTTTLDEDVIGFLREYSTSFSYSLTTPYSLPSVLIETSSAKIGNKIYIFGGYSSGGVSTDIIEFDLDSKMFNVLNVKLPSGRRLTSAAAYGTKIYIFGGYVGGAVSQEILEFDTIAKTIITLSIKLPSGRSETFAVSNDNKIYVIGGYSGYGMLSEIIEFDAITKTLSILGTRLPSTRSGVTAARFASKIYIFGGFDGAVYLNDILELDTATKSISVLNAKLPSILAFANASIKGNKIYIFGGVKGPNSSDFLNTITEFDVTTKLITVLSVKLSPGRGYATSVASGNDIYLFGGLTYGGRIAQVVKLTLIPIGDSPNVYLPRAMIERLLAAKANAFIVGKGLLQEGNNLSAKTAYTHTDVNVPTTSWIAHTDSMFKFKAEIQLPISYQGLDSHVPTVIFGLFEAVSGNYAPVCELRYDDALLKEIVTIFAIDKPSADIVIPTITVEVA